MGSDAEFDPVFPFLNDTWDFCNGVEIGMLYRDMEKGEFEFEGIYHIGNQAQIEVMAQAMKYAAVFEPDEEEYWLKVKFSKRMLRLV
jgi:hypothetical protein